MLDLILMDQGDGPGGPLREPRTEELGRLHGLARQGGRGESLSCTSSGPLGTLLHILVEFM